MLAETGISDTYGYANNYKFAQSRPVRQIHRMATSKVFIFDTTLRDGEQAPGCSMTTSEKVRMAGKLAELGVDIMEAGFPIASDRRFRGGAGGQPDAAREGGGARALHGAGHRARRAGAGEGQAPGAHPHVPRHQRHPPQVQAEEDAGAGARGGGQGRRAGAQVRRRRRVLRRGRRPHRGRLPDRRFARGRRGRRQHRQHPRHRRLRAFPRSTAR